MRYVGWIRSAVLGRAVFLAIALVALAAAPALAHGQEPTRHHHPKRHHTGANDDLAGGISGIVSH